MERERKKEPQGTCRKGAGKESQNLSNKPSSFVQSSDSLSLRTYSSPPIFLYIHALLSHSCTSLLRLYSLSDTVLMATHHIFSLSFLLILIVLSSVPQMSVSLRVFTIINDCKETIWPAVFPGEYFDGGGFVLKPGQSRVFTAPVSWSGRIWSRTGCNFDKAGTGNCQSGRCGTSLKCSGSGETPATLAEFTLASLDFYDVSLVDGFNVPLVVTPINGKGNCSVGGCDKDLRLTCPSELAVKAGGKTVGCRSACDVFKTDEYCCKGNYGNPMTCQPTYYSKKFKEACPTAYSYAYDDPTSILTCSGTDYVITFCSSRKQTVCTYHNHKLVCSGSKGLRSLIGGWWTVMLTVLLPINLWIKPFF